MIRPSGYKGKVDNILGGTFPKRYESMAGAAEILENLGERWVGPPGVLLKATMPIPILGYQTLRRNSG